MPAQLIAFMIDLYILQLQSVEHTNKDVKLKQAQCSNRKQSHHEQENVVQYKRTSKLGKEHWVKTHSRDSGPNRSEQVLKLKLIGSATDDNSKTRTCEEESRLNSAKKMKFEHNIRTKLAPLAFNVDNT